MKKVVILGCGPAGLLAAHAAARKGCEVTIYSIANKSYISGAQYIHRIIPGVTNSVPHGFVHYRHLGTKEGYATKVYGDPNAPVSWGQYRGTLPYWSMITVYDKLWDMYHDLIHDTAVDYEFVEKITFDNQYDLVVSSVPLPAICLNKEQWQWTWQDVWIEPKAQSRVGQNEIVYNGVSMWPWYRSSRLGEFEATEYPRDAKAKLTSEARIISKPVATNCEEWPGVLRVGRYGKWDKRELAHGAYYDVDRYLGATPY